MTSLCVIAYGLIVGFRIYIEWFCRIEDEDHTFSIFIKYVKAFIAETLFETLCIVLNQIVFFEGEELRVVIFENIMRSIIILDYIVDCSTFIPVFYDLKILPTTIWNQHYGFRCFLSICRSSFHFC